MFKASIVYKENLESEFRININQGGTASGKTYALIQLCFTIAMREPNVVITVTAQDVPNLRRGAYRDAKSIWSSSDTLRRWFDRPNETNRVFTCLNGSIIEFTSFQDEQDAKGGKRDYLFVNEADAFTFDVYRQLAIRTSKKIFIDYNPSQRFWVHNELIGRPDVKLIISDHRHNPFLSEDKHNEIEGIQDPEFFKVYARGKTGKLEGLVYNNYDIVDRMPETYKKEFFGLDFGFTNDPTALVRVVLSEGDLWIDELIAERGLTNPAIAEEAKLQGVNSQSIIIADSAEPKSIEELKRLGLKVEAAQKGADSIKTGIDILQRYKLHVTRRSSLVLSELARYRWCKDSKSGKLINKPIDMFNHTMDAIRYVALNKLGEKRISSGAKFITTNYQM